MTTEIPETVPIQNGLHLQKNSAFALPRLCKPRLELFFLKRALFFHLRFGRYRPPFIPPHPQPFHEYPHPVGAAFDPRPFLYLGGGLLHAARRMFPSIGLQTRLMGQQLASRTPKPDLLESFSVLSHM
jgi:hypothetical protein